jgi:DNA-binding NarL/FixJ family response regulator
MAGRGQQRLFSPPAGNRVRYPKGTFMRAKNIGIPTYIVASNRLAGEYLVGVLANDRLVRPIFCEQLPQPRLRSQATIFVIEGSLIPLPLTECIRRLRFLFPKGRFVMVDRAQPDEEIVRLIRLGFHGFVEHSQVRESLADAVRTVATGRLWISDRLMHAYVNTTAEVRTSDGARLSVPTPRETEVLELVRRRLSNKEIAAMLEISESTVKYHLSNVLTKFRVGTRRELEATAKAGPAGVWEQLSRTRVP